MFTLLGEVNLWTFDDNINIKSTDFGAFRYHDKRIDHLHEEAKKSYCQKRGMIYVPTNKKGNKLKDSIKYLEEQLKDNTIVHCQWYDDCVLQLMLNNALLIQIQVNIATGDVCKITFDKYLIGKLLEHISDVIITKNYILCIYNDNQVSVVHFTRSKRHVFDKINKLEPKLSTIDLFGPNGRRLDKKVQTNKCGDLILIWWKSTINEVYPWSPAVKEHDRANIHLYRLIGVKLELICYIRSEFDPLCIMFDACNDNIIHSVEQKVSRKGEVTIEWRTYEVSQQDKLQRIAVVSVSLPTHTSCVKFSPTQELLLLCCIDGSVIIYDQTRATTASVKAAFIPTLASWHSDGIIFVVGNDKGQFQHFDIALSCIKSQTLTEEAAQANILDLSSYFRIQPALLRMEWNKKTDLNCYINLHNHGNSLLLLIFQRGPLGVLKMLEGNSFTGDVLVKRYLSLSQVEQATSLLLAMNWDTHSRACMHALNQIVNYLFKLPLTTERENLIQNALGSFHVPIKPISQAIEEEYGDEIRDLTRRFFHHLLRYHMFEKAFRLAIDLNDHDLFMDIHFYAIVVNDTAMATAAKENAERILSRSNSCSSSHSTCSRASCSLCSDSISDKGEVSYSDESDNFSKENQTDIKSKCHNYKKETSNQIPPLPVLHPHTLHKNLLSTSFTDISPNEKTDCNLETKSFSISNNTLTTTSFHHSSHLSLPNTFFTSTSFNKPLYKIHAHPTSVSTMSSTSNSQSLNNISDDLMTTSFGSLSLNERKTGISNRINENSVDTTLKKVLRGEMQLPLDNIPNDTITTNLVQENSFMSTPFNSLTHESVTSDVSSNLLKSSLDNIDNNIMSTSFSTLGTDISNPYDKSFNDLVTTKSDSNTVSSPLKNIKPSVTISNFVSKTHSDSVVTNKLTCNLHNNHSNLASTSFNFLDNQVKDSCNGSSNNFNNDDNPSIVKLQQPFLGKKQVDFNIPPPPSLTNSFTNYFQSLPKKNLPLSRSTSGLADIDESIKKFSSIRTRNVNSYLLQRQNSASNILQDQPKYTNIKSRCRFNYDFGYISLHGSCDNIDMHSSNNMRLGNSQFSSTYGAQNRFDRHSKLVSPQNSTNTNISKESKISSNIPPLPIISPSTSSSTSCSSFPTFTDTTLTTNEKPKVKFSDTVTHILVPGTGQSHKQKRSTITQVHLTDPKRELAESLPLCLGNEDYLKDFQPLPKETINDKEKESSRQEEGSKIKVVHFGLL
ncbi:WD repeat-containing and planar cell polarity effector protein fritz isoform X1 [Bombus terrestris]|uniref:WD repeat-containing and planar cell polarity effector protein fritz isoform X1 n=1 Tax=Bombus terrestris TaxID=30195 RepID=A0A9B2JQI9_BOMTE|nr:WD repeat-containing and planar cell polarity effector protein fritz isoform X1 [Bombus terrestris]XP_048263884.1 WD repeat-containing and planar cell polarity effector protein fritz isoform X1 [Bombus terrestris]